MSERKKKSKGSKEKDGGGSVSYVSLIQDPFGIRNHEISEAQNSTEELPLNEVGDEIEGEAAAAEADAPLESEPNAAWLDAAVDAPPATDDNIPAADAAALSSAAEALGGPQEDDRLRRAREMPDLGADDWDEIPSQGIDISQLRGELAADSRDEFKPVPDTGELDSMARAMAEQDEFAKSAASELADWTPDAQADKKAAEADEQARIRDDQALQAEQAQAEAAKDSEDEDDADPELGAALPHPDPETGALDLAEVQSCLEALLFMLDKPARLERLREMIGPDFPL